MGQHDDERLLSELNALLDLADPVPADLVERVRFAIEIEDIDVEAAQWERGALAGVRGDSPGTITFYVGDLTVMFNVTRTGECHRIDGWLVPAGEHGVEVRVAEHGSTTTTSDEGGRFVLNEVPRGITQILVRMSGGTPRTVVTPTVVL